MKKLLHSMLHISRRIPAPKGETRQFVMHSLTSAEEQQATNQNADLQQLGALAMHFTCVRAYSILVRACVAPLAGTARTAELLALKL